MPFQVAAKVKSDEEKDEWFVVKVIHFDKETKEYEVLDEEPGDDEESAQKYEISPGLSFWFLVCFYYNNQVIFQYIPIPEMFIDTEPLGPSSSFC
jgi:hypothetical protein